MQRRSKRLRNNAESESHAVSKVQRTARRRQSRTVVPVSALGAREQAPERLRPDFYFDFNANSFAHEALFNDCVTTIAVVDRIHAYCEETLRSRRPRVGRALLPQSLGAEQ